eukprot:5658074-Pleurochrysis_carterae.AAC.2
MEKTIIEQAYFALQANRSDLASVKRSTWALNKSVSAVEFLAMPLRSHRHHVLRKCRLTVAKVTAGGEGPFIDKSRLTNQRIRGAER